MGILCSLGALFLDFHMFNYAESPFLFESQWKLYYFGDQHNTLPSSASWSMRNKTEVQPP